MIWTVIGAAAFPLFLFYDVMSMKHRKWPVLFFAAGGACLIAATYMYSHSDVAARLETSPSIVWLGAFGALVSLGFLIYVLFVSLPAGRTYLDGGRRPVVKTGWYGVCRHPGVIWLSLFYFFVFLAAMSGPAFFAWILYTALDILYVAIQERFIFSKVLYGYGEYVREVPFLCPRMRKKQK